MSWRKILITKCQEVLRACVLTAVRMKQNSKYYIANGVTRSRVPKVETDSNAAPSIDLESGTIRLNVIVWQPDFDEYLGSIPTVSTSVANTQTFGKRSSFQR